MAKVRSEKVEGIKIREGEKERIGKFTVSRVSRVTRIPRSASAASRHTSSVWAFLRNGPR